MHIRKIQCILCTLIHKEHTKLHPPGLLPFGVTTLLSWPVEPCPRPLVGLTGLGLSVGTYLTVGAGGLTVVAGGLGALGLTAGFSEKGLVPAFALPVDT